MEGRIRNEQNRKEKGLKRYREVRRTKEFNAMN